MDQTQLQNKIAEYYQKLPEQTKVLFAGMSWLATLKELDTKYSLNEEQTKTLGTETTLVLLGIITPDDYKQTLKTEIKLDVNKTEELTKEIEDKIIKDIEPLLYETFNKNILSLAEESNNTNPDDYKQKIYEIGNKYKLPIDKMGEIEEITDKFINGKISATQYEEKLSLVTDLPESKITEIINDINENIIKVVRQKIIIPEKVEVLLEEEDIPLPPYKKTEEDVIPAPPKDYKEETKNPNIKLVNDGIDLDLDGVDFDQKNNPDKIVLENKPLEQVKINKDIKIEEEKEVQPKKEDSPMAGMLSDKLIGNTASNTTVSDYSISKIKTETQSNNEVGVNISSKKHDPYHEEI